MTDIKLMNYGRGAGKSFTLNKWVQEAPKNRYVVCERKNVKTYLESGKIERLYFYSDTASYDGFRGFNDIEVAFDDLDLKNETHLHVFQKIMGFRPKTVILATSYEAVQTEAAKLADENPQSKLSEAYWRLNQGFKVDEKGGLTNGGITHYLPELKDHDIRVTPEKGNPEVSVGSLSDAQCAEMEPIQTVRTKDLRIGDFIQHKGYVSAIGPSHYGQTHLQVTLKDTNPHFDGTLHVRVDHLHDVDTTKRK